MISLVASCCSPVCCVTDSCRQGQAIRDRHDAIEHFLDDPEKAKQLAKCLRHVKPIPRCVIVIASSCFAGSRSQHGILVLCRLLQHVQAAIQPKAADLHSIKRSASSLLELKRLLTATQDGASAAFVGYCVHASQTQVLDQALSSAGPSDTDMEDNELRPSMERKALACIGSELLSCAPCALHLQAMLTLCSGLMPG